ncbi:hypothetical protein BLNAU_20403 [Blattamonas nauphoetae]|uniref:Uncharacterized protein n=1 Tax=Blattamonas nauphoetae TaxID=2049346 RepID=A0ABQ9WYT4_9EUKA|nr:hypothetical protein BLNAU_20403 [Blattamonas nauphoetae]
MTPPSSVDVMSVKMHMVKVDDDVRTNGGVDEGYACLVESTEQYEKVELVKMKSPQWLIFGVRRQQKPFELSVEDNQGRVYCGVCADGGMDRRVAVSDEMMWKAEAEQETDSLNKRAGSSG